MKSIIYNNEGPFPSWREETPEETLVREMRQHGRKESSEEIIGAANLYELANEQWKRNNIQ